MTLTDAQRELLEDKHSLWVRAAETGPPDLRDYNRRAADALRIALSLASSAAAAEAKVGVLEEDIQVIGRYARSDGDRTFDDCIRDLALIDDRCRALTQEPSHEPE
jgi:hypothetical protein